MHMADALVAPAVAGTMYALSTAAVGFSTKKIRLEQDEKKIPLMGVMGAFVFAAQMINFTIPGTGASGHLCGGVLLTAILGPYAGFITMTVILLIQCLIFADGGLLALGCNVWNMAFYSCLLGGFLLWRTCMRKGVSKKRIVTASLLSSVLTLQLGAFSVVLETLASGITELPFSLFVAAMQPIHLLIGIVEGLVTAGILLFLFEARRELVWTGAQERDAEAAADDIERKSVSLKWVILMMAAAAAVTAGFFSLFASSDPDGLEWSVERITGETELEESGSAGEAAASVQDKTAFMPDYSFRQSGSAAGTTVSGLLGGCLVVALCVAACYAFRFFRYGSTDRKGSRERQEHEQT